MLFGIWTEQSRRYRSNFFAVIDHRCQLLSLVRGSAVRLSGIVVRESIVNEDLLPYTAQRDVVVIDDQCGPNKPVEDTITVIVTSFVLSHMICMKSFHEI